MQEIIIGLIGFTTVVLIGVRIFRSLNPKKKSSCDGCSGCPLKESADCMPEKRVKKTNRK